jgi:hypothetical protein
MTDTVVSSETTEREVLVVEDASVVATEAKDIEVLVIEEQQQAEVLVAEDEAVVVTSQDNSIVVTFAEQGPPGAQGIPGLGVALPSRMNTDLVVLKKGWPVYASSSSAVKRARANDATMKDVLGLVRDDTIAVGAVGLIQVEDIIVCTIAEWQVITGMVGGLVPKATYWLDVALGKLTPFPPSGSGVYLCNVGVALTPTDFLIRIEPTIQL